LAASLHAACPGGSGGLAGSNTLVFSTYLGGDQVDEAFGVALDLTGAVLLTGRTFSTVSFPADAFQEANAGSYDAPRPIPTGTRRSASTS